MIEHRETLRVFLDCEFTDFAHPDLISIGLVSDTGAEFYGENGSFNATRSSDFVRANVYPLLGPVEARKTRIELSARLWCWLDELPCTKIIILADYPGDWTLMKDLLDQVHPKVSFSLIPDRIAQWCIANTLKLGAPPHDFYQMQQSMNNLFFRGVQDYFRETGEINHHALSDAKANRRGYTYLTTDFGMPL